MEWIADPTALFGLGTLILLEIVLGIDNLIFIAILVDKLPPAQRNRARIIGLPLALLMRIAMRLGRGSPQRPSEEDRARGSPQFRLPSLICGLGG